MRIPALLRRPSPIQLAQAIEAFVLLVGARWQVRRGRWPAQWKAEPVSRPGPPNGAARCGSAHQPAILLVQQALQRAERIVPGETRCLPAALAARAMLARRGVRATLQVGTAREADGQDRFHAWLKLDGRFVTGRCDERLYAPFRPASDAAPLEAVAPRCQRIRP